MNQINLIGRISTDPITKYTVEKEPIAHSIFNFAVPDMSMKKDASGNYQTDYFSCSSWGKVAELIEQYCVKGMKFLITGRLKNNNYEKDGKKVYSNEVAIDTVEFLEPKRNDDAQKD